MGFGDLKSDSGLKSLNEFLADKSYIEGFQPSQADSAVFAALSGAPKAAFAHALRWFTNIKSFSRDSLPGVKKAVGSYGPSGDASAAGKKDEADDDDFDLFGSDDEEEQEAAEKLKQERLAKYAEKKSKKAAVIAKSNVIFDVKPWDDETDMKEVENHVRSIEMDGLRWGAGKLEPLAFGIKKFQITCCIEDDKVSTEELEERITANEDLVQSVDIAAFNKL